jgi:hypothetical protein
MAYTSELEPQNQNQELDKLCASVVIMAMQI